MENDWTDALRQHVETQTGKHLAQFGIIMLELVVSDCDLLIMQTQQMRQPDGVSQEAYALTRKTFIDGVNAARNAAQARITALREETANEQRRRDG